MRIAFMGTPTFAATALGALIATGHQIVCVYTQPPRPANRGKSLTKSAVHDLADVNGLTVRTPEKLKDPADCAAFVALDLDVAIVAAYGQILPFAILDAPRRGCINIHASLLPRWRGAAPIHRAIMAGDAETGVTIMQMETGLDTGPMLIRKACVIEAGDTSGSLQDKLAHMGSKLIVKALTELNHLTAVPQPAEGITYARKVDKADARLDFSKAAADIERVIRAMQPSPGAWFEYGGERIKVIASCLPSTTEAKPGRESEVVDDHLTITCGNATTLRPTIVQRAGRAPVTTAEFLRGFPVPAGTRLT